MEPTFWLTTRRWLAWLVLLCLGGARSRPPARASPAALNQPPVVIQNHEDPWANLDQPLLYLSPNDPLTMRSSFTQIHVYGSVGSGKTSGSISALTRAMLAQGYGMICMAAKSDDADTYFNYAKAAGREKQVIRVTPDGPWTFAWLSYELQHSSSVEDVVHLISLISDLVEGKRTDSGDPYWQRAAQVLVRSAVSLLQIADEPISLDTICDLVRDAPDSPDDVADESWRERSYCASVIALADARKTPEQETEFELCCAYYLSEYARLNSRTKSSIVATLTSIADVLLHGYLRRLLGSETTFTPEMLFDGAIILLDLPTVRGAANRIAQGIIKLCVQRAILRRSIKQHPRPVAIICDEAQEFVSAFDYEFLAMCRSARCANIYGTQTTNNYYAKLGSNSKDAASALLALFNLHIFHRNSDTNTNNYAADLIAKQWTNLTSTNISHGEMRGGSHGSGTSMSLQHRVLPGDFQMLRAGGPANSLCVDAIIAGPIFSTGEPYLRTTFKQQ